jgi:hypothetical protein
MGTEQIEVAIKGKRVKAPSISVENRTIFVSGKWIRLASVHDEEWVEGEVLKNPDAAIARIKEQKLKADILTFPQKITCTEPQHKFYFEWDNYAVIPLTTHAAWWEKLPQESRRNVRIAGKRGVVVAPVAFDDHLVRGIVGIYNESANRQGRAFPHYGKNFETVKAENATYAGRSQFIAAYAGEELIGFLKLVYIDEIASIMQILSKNAHLDKKPMNAMLAKAVELCEQHGSKHLVYRKYTYGKVYSALTEFKRRNGFVKVEFPRYYVALTLKGKLALKLRLHVGFRDSLPPGLVTWITTTRSKYRSLFGPEKSVATPTR